MNALVTGGGGFLGGAIVRRLLARGDRVASFSRRRHPELDALGVAQFQGDISDLGRLRKAARGCDVVFHAAARAGIAGPAQGYFRTNVIGTLNVLNACHRLGIRRVVYTSSPSVVFDGQDMEGVNESVPYPRRYEAAYPRTKAIGEGLVLHANSPTLATVALRPHLVWGPGDNHLVPRLIARARAGRLRRIGWTSKLIDSVYIDNAADAHLLAADRLAPGSVVAGKAYFITNGEPMPLWDLVNGILHAAGLGPVRRVLPTRVAWAAASLLEGVCAVLPGEREPPLTRFVVRELTTAHWFDISAARRDLGYEPAVSIAEGLRRLAAHLAGAPLRC